MCVQVPCVYLLYTASAVTVQNTNPLEFIEFFNEHSVCSISVSPGIEPGGIVFPSQNNNIVPGLFGVLQAMWKLEIFSSVPGRL